MPDVKIKYDFDVLYIFCKMFAVQIFYLIIICFFCLPFGLDVLKIIDGLGFNVHAYRIIGRHKENDYNKIRSLFCITYQANVETTKLNAQKNFVPRITYYDFVLGFWRTMFFQDACIYNVWSCILIAFQCRFSYAFK